MPRYLQIPHRWTHLLALLLVVPVWLGGTARAQAPGEDSAVIARSCDRACLLGFLHSYLDALVHKDLKRAAFAPGVRFTENNVELPLGGEGLWASVSAVASTGLEATDIDTGNAAWFGTVDEHGVTAYFAFRLKVEGGRITEVETVVHRKTARPAPFGDPQKLVHDAAFAEVLPPEQRRARERLIAVANGYFSTVELNDGQVLTSFDPDCQRTENGISTTQGSAGAAAISAGCEAQFKLGIYRINKRVRERRYPLVDEERGVVVASAFFDHANTFDTYQTTDGKTMHTALKWPNSISLLEAFRIRNGQIHRIETVFTYVPYFMHSPFATPAPRPVAARPSAASVSARATMPCDRSCLMRTADGYMDALVAHDPSRVAWADSVRYSENSVSMMVGDGEWGVATARSEKPLYVADPSSGNVLWVGTVDEHGEPAYYAMRLKVVDGKVAEVEAVLTRKGDQGPFGDPRAYEHDPSFSEVVAPSQRLSRKRLVALADGYFATVERNDGTIRTRFDRECERQENGQSTTNGKFATVALGCESQFKLGVFRFDDRVRRRFPIVDEERGIAVGIAYFDHGAKFDEYKTTDGKTAHNPFKSPNSIGLIEVFKIRNGQLYRIEAVFSTLPYGMSSQWMAGDCRAESCR